MGRLTTDSPICRRIALAFLDFLQSVEPAPDVDPEGLDVARECLEEAFKLEQSSVDDRIQPGLLVNLFSSTEGPNDLNSGPVNAEAPPKASTTTSIPSSTDGCIPVPGTSKSKEQNGDPLVEGISRDELFGQFYAALDKINFFAATPGGEEDHMQLTKATNFFEEALLEMEKLGNQTINQTILAEMFKSQGNRNMQSKLYPEAIDLYTCAIALSDKNAIYYCNRAAAYTQISKYDEAIMDCRKSIEIDPNYVKAYSRHGLVFYALGKYKEAVVLFLKALQLDPNNDSVRENIRVAQQKWREEQHHAETDHQNSGSSNGHSQQQNQQPADSRNHGAGFQIPFNVPEFAHAFMNMAPGAGSSQSQEQDHQPAGSGSRGSPFASFSTDSSMPIDLSQIMGMMSGGLGQHGHATAPTGNAGGSNGININLQELPQQLSGVLGSVVDMFTSQNGQQDTSRSDPRS